MALQSKGCACIDAGGAYVTMMAHCEKLQIIGALSDLRNSDPVDEIEFAAVPKASLIGVLRNCFTIVREDECEIVFIYHGTTISVTKCTHQTFECVIKEAV